MARYIAFVLLLALAGCDGGPASPTGPASATPPATGSSTVPTPPPPPPAPPASSPLNAPLAFTTSRDFPPQHIYVVDHEGAAPRLVTSGREPAWSRQGRIAFNSVGGGLAMGIHVINADGTGRRFVGDGYAPSWSPDGREVAVERNGGIFALDVESGMARLIAVAPPGYEFAARPAWSPDGGRIAFSACSSYVDAWDVGTVCGPVHVAPASGHGPALPTAVDHAFSPAWSPDGQQIAYESGSWISVVDLNTGSRQTVGRGSQPDWSPDGRVVYHGYGGRRDGTRIFIADHGSERQIVPDDEAPARANYSDYELSVRR